MTQSEQAKEQWVTAQQARAAVVRFNASHFSSYSTTLGEKARYSIPADPNRDDDFLLNRFIDQYEQYESALATAREALAESKEMIALLVAHVPDAFHEDRQAGARLIVKLAVLEAQA